MNQPFRGGGRFGTEKLTKAEGEAYTLYLTRCRQDNHEKDLYWASQKVKVKKWFEDPTRYHPSGWMTVKETPQDFTELPPAELSETDWLYWYNKEKADKEKKGKP